MKLGAGLTHPVEDLDGVSGLRREGVSEQAIASAAHLDCTH